MAISGELSLPVESGERAISQVNTLVDLYSRHQQRIYRYCLALLRNPDDAEDATQETFTRAAPFLPNLPGDLSAYLTTVARNICCDVVRARARRFVPIEEVPLADRKVSPERQSVDWDVVRRMWRQLSPSERLLFAYTFAGYKYEEIASRTGMSRPSVSVGLARARRRLRDLAAATGTLGVLPLGLRRLLDRLSRRAQAAMSSAQATVLGMADQAGAVVASLLSGLFVVSGSAAMAQAPMIPVAAHAGLTAASGPAGTQPVALALPAGAGRLAADSAAAVPSGHSTSSGVPRLPAGASAALPGADATPLDLGVSEMAASPNYPTDHTVLVAGNVLRDNCIGTGPGCQALFITHDGGANWNRLAYLTYTDGPLLLPPTYPADPAIFMLTDNTALEESLRGDGTFRVAIPEVTAAAVAPWSAPDDAELATIIGQTMQVYDAGAEAPRSVASVPAGMIATGVAFVAPDTVAVSGYMKAATSTSSAVALCPLSGVCAAPVVLAGAADTQPVLATSPRVADDHLVVAMTGQATYVSRDAGRTFGLALAAAPATYFSRVSVGNGPVGPRILLNTTTAGAAPWRIGLLSSDDLGRTFSDITGNLGATSSLVGTAAYSDGTILAGLSADALNRFALRQTAGNRSWVRPA